MATKLEQQIDKALAVLSAHKKPVRYIVRKPRRPAGKGRAAGGGGGAFPPGYVVWRPRDPRSGKALWEIAAPNGEALGDFDLRREALAAANAHAQLTDENRQQRHALGASPRKRPAGKGRAGGGAFAVGDTVRSNTDAQGLVSGRTYTITDVRHRYTPFGDFSTYVVRGADGAEHAIGNAHLLLSRVGAGGKPRKRRAKKSR